MYSVLGHIDLDPCAGIDTSIASVNWAIERGENGLDREWFGFVYCNPPFSKKEAYHYSGNQLNIKINIGKQDPVFQYLSFDFMNQSFIAN